MKIKTYFRVLKDILSEVVQFAGKRRWNLFIAEATREQLDRTGP